MATRCCAAKPATLPRAVKLRHRRRASRRHVASVKCDQHLEAASEAAAEAEANRLGQQLRRWVEDEGGLVHPALQLSMATTHGSRGLVAQEAISAEAAAQAPLVAVPERCLLTTSVAQERLGPLLAGGGRQPEQQPWWAPARQQPLRQQPPPPELLLALLLAAERRRGAGSYWWPYIAALSPSPPCGWAMPAEQLGAELAGLGSMAAGWSPQVQAAAAAVERQAQAAAAAYGERLGGVTAGDVRWALGHVLSRCFGSGADLALLPFIDCCNHQQYADQPDGFTSAAGEPSAAITCRHRGAAQALPAGGELLISYVAGTTPLSMFLNFGFVPPEHCRPA